ncbi:MAG TPA: peptidylprolyl isomerase [Thermoanaerobaculia bacterium]|nr:peptidylprolyl isomerase [Thermoanaerobaculia bacterium]
MKKDAVIAIVAILAAFGLTYAIAATRVPPPLQPTQPFSMTEPPVAAAGPEAPPAGNVIMRVNGEPITENEFSAAFASMPAELQQQFANEQGKKAFADQMVKMKVLEQEARRRKLTQDPGVAGQIAANQTEVLAGAAVQKLVEKVTPAEVQKFYNENQQRLQTVELSHIVIAYQGGMIPPKSGGPAPDQQTAMNKALQIYQQLKEGANFSDLAKRESDDTASGVRGGLLGPVGPGMLPQELDARVMSLKEGEISPAIPSRYGIHIFKAGKRQAQPLSEVQDRLAVAVRNQETMRRIEELVKAAKVELDPKFFPPSQPAPKRPPA